jgi:GNAT superfamily N-acetyltransferase
VQPYFRDAVGGDVPAIATILGSAAPDDERRRVALRRALDDIDRHDGSYVLVAEYDRQIGAVLQMTVFPLLHHGGHAAQIVGLWVAEPFRTSGLDAMLLDHALERADDLGCHRVQVMVDGGDRTQRARWERAGFIHAEAGYVRDVRRGIARPPLRRIS